MPAVLVTGATVTQYSAFWQKECRCIFFSSNFIFQLFVTVSLYQFGLISFSMALNENKGATLNRPLRRLLAMQS